MRTLAIDTGNKAMKTPLICFPAGLVKHGSMRPPDSTDSGKTDEIFFNGEYYSLSSIRMPYRYDKTVDDYYLVLTLFAAAKHILASVPPASEYKLDVALSMGLPPMHKMDLQDKYVEHFSFGGQEVEFLYNGIQFRLRVRKVFVWMQGYAAIVPIFKELAQYPNVHIIDIGGFTTDVMMLNHGKIEQGVIDTIEEVGVIHFYNDVVKAVKGQLKMTLTDPVIESILDGRYPLDEDPVIQQASAIIYKLKDEYASDLVRLFRERKYDLMASLPVFIGGGSLLFKESLQKALPDKMVKFVEDVKANAIGYERLCNAARNQKAG